MSIFIIYLLIGVCVSTFGIIKVRAWENAGLANTFQNVTATIAAGIFIALLWPIFIYGWIVFD